MVASPGHNDDEQPSRLGYFAAIFVSAIGHGAIFALANFVNPKPREMTINVHQDKFLKK